MHYKGDTAKNINASKERTGWLHQAPYLFTVKLYRDTKLLMSNKKQWQENML